MSVSARRSSRFSMRSKQLGQLLIENGDVQVEQVNKAIRVQEQQGGLLGQILRQMGACTDEAIGNALLKQVQVTDIQCEEIYAPLDVLELVPREQCDGEKLCPFERLDNLLCLVMGNPLNRRAINAIEEATRLKVKPFKAPWPKIKDLLERSYSQSPGAPASEPTMDEVAGVDLAPSLDDLSAQAEADVEAEAAPAAMAEAQPEALAEPEELTEPEPLAEPEPLTEPEPLAEPEIEGLDNLDESNAEVIETDARGLARKRRQQKPDNEPYRMPKKEAKVNIDLDNFDVGTAEEVVEAAEEALPVVPQQVRAARADGMGPLHKFSTVSTGFFYAGATPPESDATAGAELQQLVHSWPAAETVADSIADYHRQRAEKAEKEAATATGGIPVEATKVPDGKFAALALTENDFQQLAAGMQVDRRGEWLWQYAMPGPVAVQEYQAEG